MRTFATRSPQAVQYCPDCRRKRVRASQREYDERRREKCADEQRRAAEASLDKRLDNAEFTVLEDAGPEEEAFPKGARLTTSDVDYLLRDEFIAVGSLFVHNETGIRYRVERGERGRLVLVEQTGDRRRGTDDGRQTTDDGAGDGSTDKRMTEDWLRIGENEPESAQNQPRIGENRPK